MTDRINHSLQENLITLLAHNDEFGRIVTRLVDAKYYEGEYRLVAERCIDYWARYRQAPKLHTADLFADVLEEKGNKRAASLKRVLTMMAELAPSANGKYITEQATNFIRLQQLEAAVLAAYENLKRHKEGAISTVEEDWSNIIRQKVIAFDPGMRLEEVDRVLEYRERKTKEFITGIDQLDHARVVPSRGTLMMMIAGAKGGKSWWLINLGKWALMLHKKVVHISLENSEEETVQRYWQALWAISNTQSAIEVSRLKVNKRGNLIDITPDREMPDISFDNVLVRDELGARVFEDSNIIRNMRVKRFPPGHLTPMQLRAYLDNLEQERFIPDMLILDYASLMKADPRNLRIETGFNIRELRAIAVERNIAVVSAHQASREGVKEGTVQAHHVAEDWSVVQTADTILTYSATKAEKELNLGRLYVEMSRSESDSWGLILSQAYGIGQFCLKAARMTDSSKEVLKEFVQPDDDNEDHDDGDDE